MRVLTTLKELALEDALAPVERGDAAFVDLRAIDAYLEAHIRGSLELLYEFGPGMAVRARDCLPLGLALILLDGGSGDLRNAAAALRGKGFTVLGMVPDAMGRWIDAGRRLTSTEQQPGGDRPAGALLHVGDPGAPRVADATHIPIERLWGRVAEIAGNRRVVVVAGYGVRAALAVGMLERAGVREVVLWHPAR